MRFGHSNKDLGVYPHMNLAVGKITSDGVALWGIDFPVSIVDIDISMERWP